MLPEAVAIITIEMGSCQTFAAIGLNLLKFRTYRHAAWNDLTREEKTALIGNIAILQLYFSNILKIQLAYVQNIKNTSLWWKELDD